MEPQQTQQESGQESPASANAPVTRNDNEALLGVISYIGPLVIISYILGKDMPFVRFHAKQGMVVFAIEVIAWILGSMLWQFWPFVSLINLATLILSILGIVNVIQRKEQELPLVGSFSKYVTF